MADDFCGAGFGCFDGRADCRDRSAGYSNADDAKFDRANRATLTDELRTGSIMVGRRGAAVCVGARDEGEKVSTIRVSRWVNGLERKRPRLPELR